MSPPLTLEALEIDKHPPPPSRRKFTLRELHSYLFDDVTFQHLHLWRKILLDVSVNLIKDALKQRFQHVMFLHFSLVQPSLRRFKIQTISQPGKLDNEGDFVFKDGNMVDCLTSHGWRQTQGNRESMLPL